MEPLSSSRPTSPQRTRSIPSELIPDVELSTAAPEDESAPGTDDINALVTNAKSRPMDGITVELAAFDEKEADFVVAASSETDEDGRVVFEDADVNPGRPAIVQAVFDDTRFTSSVVRGGNERGTPIRIRVAETTRSAKDLRVEVESVAIVGDARGAQAVHAVSIRNRGEAAYVGELRLPVLPGGTAIQVQQGFDERRASLTEGQIVARTPILPGRHDITYTYPVQSDADGIRLRRAIQIPTERFDLLVGGELDAEPSEGLRRSGDAEVGPASAKRSYRKYSATDLERADEVSARVIVAKSTSPLLIAGPIGAAVLAVAIVAIPLLRRRRRLRAAAAPTDKLESTGMSAARGASKSPDWCAASVSTDVLSGLDLAVQPGEHVTVTGPNGAGKTTLLRVLCGLLRPTSGRVAVLGGETCGSACATTHRRHRTLPVPLHTHDRSRERSVLGQPLRRTGCHAIEVATLLIELGLDPGDKRVVGSYSQGMRQRVGVARAFCISPDLVIADEPLRRARCRRRAGRRVTPQQSEHSDRRHARPNATCKREGLRHLPAAGSNALSPCASCCGSFGRTR